MNSTPRYSFSETILLGSRPRYYFGEKILLGSRPRYCFGDKIWLSSRPRYSFEENMLVSSTRQKKIIKPGSVCMQSSLKCSARNRSKTFMPELVQSVMKKSNCGPHKEMT